MNNCPDKAKKEAYLAKQAERRRRHGRRQVDRATRTVMLSAAGRRLCTGRR